MYVFDTDSMRQIQIDYIYRKLMNRLHHDQIPQIAK